MVLWRIFKPNLPKLAVTLPMLALALRVREWDATSKLTYQIIVGFPFTSGVIDMYRGPCGGTSICTRFAVQDIYPPGLAGDILFAYALACLLWLVYGAFILRRRAEG